MRTRDLKQIGIPAGPLINKAIVACQGAHDANYDKKQIRTTLRALSDAPQEYIDHAVFGDLASALIDHRAVQARYIERDDPAPWQQWGDDLEPQSIQQMVNACRLPIAVRGALMPDAHLGYGLPIGGVLATRDGVIPYAVGVDIACRVKMSVFDLPVATIDEDRARLTHVLEDETRFGIGASFENKRRHDVLDEDWQVTKVTAQVKDKAWKQLGSSGSGNHFVEYGVLTITDDTFGLEPGEYLALLSHSGSRGAGARVADHYSKLAMSLHPELPRELSHLAWLDLDSEAGREYWAAMELMGKYARANHACIHRHIASSLGAEVQLDIENHHNFAWREAHDGEELIVHRKGATPAGDGVLGLIPGSMASRTHVVRGLGNERSLNSAAHGAGRVMSRTKAKNTLAWRDAKRVLEGERVTLLSAGLDEVPAVYKNIEQVMSDQNDLVESVATFAPRIVKMAPAGEPAED